MKYLLLAMLVCLIIASAVTAWRLPNEAAWPGALPFMQYLFPCNVSVDMYIVNRGALKRFKQPIPSSRWTIEEFEKMGQAFVEVANEKGKSRDHYYSAGVNTSVL